MWESGGADVVRTRLILSAARKLFNFTQMLIERRTLLVEAHKGRPPLLHQQTFPITCPAGKLRLNLSQRHCPTARGPRPRAPMVSRSGHSDRHRSCTITAMKRVRHAKHGMPTASQSVSQYVIGSGTLHIFAKQRWHYSTLPGPELSESHSGRTQASTMQSVMSVGN